MHLFTRSLSSVQLQISATFFRMAWSVYYSFGGFFPSFTVSLFYPCRFGVYIFLWYRAASKYTVHALLLKLTSLLQHAAEFGWYIEIIQLVTVHKSRIIKFQVFAWRTVYKVLHLYLHKLGWTMSAYQNDAGLKSEAPGTVRPKVRNRSQPSGLLCFYAIIKWYTHAQNTAPLPQEQPNATYRLNVYTHLV